MVEPTHHRLSISAQCRLLRISRSSYYYVPETNETLTLTTVIDTTFLDYAWNCSRHRVRRLMAKMGLTAVDGEDGAHADLPTSAQERLAPATATSAPDLSILAAQVDD